jgi:hypothetical protein
MRVQASRTRSWTTRSTLIWEISVNRPDEDNAMSSGQPKDAANAKREQRPSLRIIVGLFMLMLGVPPLLNALGNPRVQALHGLDVLQLIASPLVFGFGSGLLLSKPMFRGK